LAKCWVLESTFFILKFLCGGGIFIGFFFIVVAVWLQRESIGVFVN